MAHPKRRHTRTRRDKRRTHDKLVTPNLSVCPQCQQPKVPHRVCLHCGYYKGIAVIEVAEE
jgi:large subunit ribosomal protein L32